MTSTERSLGDTPEVQTLGMCHENKAVSSVSTALLHDRDFYIYGSL